MNTRAGQIRPFPYAVQKGGNLRLVMLFGFVVLVLMLYVGGKVQILRLGYQIDEMEKQKRDLERMNRSLQIEAASLSTPGRIEEIAVKRLGMVRPPKENIVVVKRKMGDGSGSEPRTSAK
jgi:cell division protein FtsL